MKREVRGQRVEVRAVEMDFPKFGNVNEAGSDGRNLNLKGV